MSPAPMTSTGDLSAMASGGPKALSTPLELSERASKMFAQASTLRAKATQIEAAATALQEACEAKRAKLNTGLREMMQIHVAELDKLAPSVYQVRLNQTIAALAVDIGDDRASISQARHLEQQLVEFLGTQDGNGYTLDPIFEDGGEDLIQVTVDHDDSELSVMADASQTFHQQEVDEVHEETANARGLQDHARSVVFPSDALSLVSVGPGKDKVNSTISDFSWGTALTRESIEQAKETTRLLEAKNKDIVRQAEVIQVAAQNPDGEVPQESVEWAATVMKWAEERKERLQEANYVLLQASEQVKRGIIPATNAREKKLRKAYLKTTQPKISKSKKGKKKRKKPEKKGGHKMMTRSKQRASPQKAAGRREKIDVDLVKDITPGASYLDGDVVGGAAPELGAENRGFALLQKMGWTRGQAIGAMGNKGSTGVIKLVVKNTKAGLGKHGRLPRAATVEDSQASDPPNEDLPKLSGNVPAIATWNESHPLDVGINVHQVADVEQNERSHPNPDYIPMDGDFDDSEGEDDLVYLGQAQRSRLPVTNDLLHDVD